MKAEVKALKKPARRPIVSGVFYLGLGLFLWFTELEQIENTWPILIIILGAAIVARSMTKSRRTESSPPPPPPPMGQNL